MIKIMLCGCNGKMGQVITRIVEAEKDAKIVCGIDKNSVSNNGYPVFEKPSDFSDVADVIIDFSHPTCLNGIIDYAKANNTSCVIATTGLSDEQKESLKIVSKDFAVFFSANMSLGVNLIISLAKKAAKLLEDNFDIEILEKHHNQKIDAPSGTAIAIADAISDSVSYETEYVYDRHSVRKKRDKKEIGIHSIRGGNIVGEHSVIFAGLDEVIEINHQATSKEVFAIGAVKAAKFIATKKSGLYDMNDLINSI